MASAHRVAGSGASCSTAGSRCGVLALGALGLEVVDDLAEARSTRVTACGRGRRSGSTGWKVPDVKSSTADAAALRRSIDLGVKTISGRRGRW
jgi:hypothetical protein